MEQIKSFFDLKLEKMQNIFIYEINFMAILKLDSFWNLAEFLLVGIICGGHQYCCLREWSNLLVQDCDATIGQTVLSTC